MTDPKPHQPEVDGDPSDTDIELLTAPLDEDDDVLGLVDKTSVDDANVYTTETPKLKRTDKPDDDTTTC